MLKFIIMSKFFITSNFSCSTAFILLLMFIESRTITRKSSIGGFTFVQEGLTFQNLKKLNFFMVQFGGIRALFGGLSPLKPPP